MCFLVVELAPSSAALDMLVYSFIVRELLMRRALHVQCFRGNRMPFIFLGLVQGRLRVDCLDCGVQYWRQRALFV
jgi:hypothetical protein